MLLLAADENFNSAIVRGLMRVKPDINLVRVQDVGLRPPKIRSFSNGRREKIASFSPTTRQP